MIQKKFLEKALEIIKQDENALGLAVAGSWITNEIDEYSDLDLVLVTRERIAPDKNNMIDFAKKLGDLLNAFTGEHVGENRLLICLYENPLLHVDIKFIIPEEYYKRVENPVIIWERDNILTKIQESSDYKFPYPDFQALEDRIWTWFHYTCQKIERGELFEAHDVLSYIRCNVISQMMQIKNGRLPRNFRKIEQNFNKEDIVLLKETIGIYDKVSIIEGLANTIKLYRKLRKEVFSAEILLREKTENAVMEYYEKMRLNINEKYN